VIANGTSDRMLDALQKATQEEIREKHQKKPVSEGLSRFGWLVMDYGDVVVHLFSPDQRKYYRLDELWQDGKPILHLQ